MIIHVFVFVLKLAYKMATILAFLCFVDLNFKSYSPKHKI